MLHFFVDRLRGVSVLTLVVFAWTYGFVILNILPQWHRLEAAQGGREVQTRAFASPEEIAATLRTFDAQMRQDAFSFYVLDVPNFILLAAAAAGVIAFGLRNLGLARSPFVWVLALPFAGAAADGIENAALALALASDNLLPAMSAVAAVAITTKIALAFYVVFPLTGLLGAIGVAAWLWRSVKGRSSAR